MSTKQTRGDETAFVEEEPSAQSGDEVAAMVGDVVNLKQVASLLGVHYMTAYRYVRQGRIAADRVGTEWRVSLSELRSFQQAALTPAVAGGSRPDLSAQWDSRVESCLLIGDETAAWKVIEMALAAGRAPTYCYVDVIAAAMASIGDRWAKGEIDVADQYLATAVALRLVSRLGARFRRSGRSRRGTVVFGAPLGELHSLPIAIASDLVRLSGYDVLELGANVPTEAFVSSVLRTPRLVAIGIGIAQPEHLAVTQDVVDAIRAVDRDVPIVVGGLGVTEFANFAFRDVTEVAASGPDAVAIIESFGRSRAIRRIS